MISPSRNAVNSKKLLYLVLSQNQMFNLLHNIHHRNGSTFSLLLNLLFQKFV